MTSVVLSAAESLEQFINEKGDPRTKEWLLMASPWPLVGLLVTYLWVCTKAGPALMRHREPFKLTKVLVAYNFVQMVGSALLFWEGLDAAWLRDYSYTCQPVDFSDDPKAVRMARAVWLYFMFKVVELIDTVFFVLRKKDQQVSFLHLYHHTMMPVCAWIGTRFLPGGHGTLLGIINCLVHVIMYCYYMLAALGPQYQRYLGWKSYVTVIQMVQFVIVFAHSAQLLFRQCNYPKGIAFLLALNAVLFLHMFGSFYYRSYVLAPKRRQAAAATAAEKQLQAAAYANGAALNNNNNNNVIGAKDQNGKIKEN